MELRGETELTREVERLQAELVLLQGELAEQKRAFALQLELYATDLNETFKEERARSQELARSYRATVQALSNAIEARDAYTARHAERVRDYGLAIARALGVTHPEENPAFEFGFLLHDIGKVAISDVILHKPAALTEDERTLMRRHPEIGAEIVRGIDFLDEAAEVVRSHHERWDGTGYPRGLRGAEIPLAARVFAVADVLDALTTDRPYRPASSFARAREMITDESGKHFDPQVVDAFNSLDDQALDRIAREAR